MTDLQPYPASSPSGIAWRGFARSHLEGRGGGVASSPGDGQRILVVEDEFLLADEMVDWLSLSGFDPVGPASSLAEAQSLLAQETRIDGVVLDVNLGGTLVFPLALELWRRGIPLVFATAYAAEVEFPAELQDRVRLRKPFSEAQLISAIGRMLDGQG